MSDDGLEASNVETRDMSWSSSEAITAHRSASLSVTNEARAKARTCLECHDAHILPPGVGSAEDVWDYNYGHRAGVTLRKKRHVFKGALR